AYKHTIGKPFLQTVAMGEQHARSFHIALDQYVIEAGEREELNCKEEGFNTKPYYFYFGSVPVSGTDPVLTVGEAILEVIRVRFSDPEKPALAKVHWYHLTLESAKSLLAEINDFIIRETISASQDSSQGHVNTFAVHLGLADCVKGL
ncbi:MAG: hypothetical protein ABH878_00075, partial [bacterium]